MSSFKFLHAADLHLDSPLLGLATKSPEFAQRVEDASRQAFDNLVGLAMAEDCQFVLFAGDVFDGELRNMRAGVENVLGLRRDGPFLRLDPCIPKAWPRFKITLRHGTARYEIVVENPDGVCRGVAYAECDGAVIEARPFRLPLASDGRVHHVLVRLGEASPEGSA